MEFDLKRAISEVIEQGFIQEKILFSRLKSLSDSDFLKCKNDVERDRKLTENWLLSRKNLWTTLHNFKLLVFLGEWNISSPFGRKERYMGHSYDGLFPQEYPKFLHYELRIDRKDKKGRPRTPNETALELIDSGTFEERWYECILSDFTEDNGFLLLESIVKFTSNMVTFIPKLPEAGKPQAYEWSEETIKRFIHSSYPHYFEFDNYESKIAEIRKEKALFFKKDLEQSKNRRIRELEEGTRIAQRVFNESYEIYSKINLGFLEDNSITSEPNCFCAFTPKDQKDSYKHCRLTLAIIKRKNIIQLFSETIPYVERGFSEEEYMAVRKHEMKAL